jgi:hypothetical protein
MRQWHIWQGSQGRRPNGQSVLAKYIAEHNLYYLNVTRNSTDVEVEEVINISWSELVAHHFMMAMERPSWPSSSPHSELVEATQYND